MLDFRIEERTGLSGPVTELELHWDAPTIKVRDLVALKVRKEVARLRAQRDTRDVSLLARLEVGDAEAFIEDKCQRAIEAMHTNAIFLFVDGRQITDLDETIPHGLETKIEFIHLIPLKGG